MRSDSFCRDLYVTEQPEEVPSMPVNPQIFQIVLPKQRSRFEKFNFEESLWDESMLERIQSSAKALKTNLYTAELASYADEKELTQETLGAVCGVFEYLEQHCPQLQCI